MEISTKDLRSNTKELFNALDRGEEVILTFHGKPRGKITGLTDKDDSKATNTAYGIWSDRDDLSSVDTYVRNLRKGRQF